MTIALLDSLARRRAPLNAVAGAPAAAPTPAPSFLDRMKSFMGAPSPTPGATPPATPGITAPMITPAQGGLAAKPPALSTGTPTPPIPMPSITPTAPQPGMMSAMGAADTGPISDFGPGNDLRYSQINPNDDPRTARLSSLVDASADKLGSAPDLTQAGLDKLAELRQQTSEDRRAGMQSIGRSAAQFGRVGSGVTTSQLGDLESVLQARELAAQKGLAGDLATQEAGDRRANLGALSGLQDQTFGQGTQRRNELRSERGYQYGVGQDSYNRDLQRRMLEEDLTNSRFNRQATAAQLGLEGAGQYDQSAEGSMGGAADLAGSLAMYNARGLTPAAATPTAPAPAGFKYLNGRLVPTTPPTTQTW